MKLQMELQGNSIAEVDTENLSAAYIGVSGFERNSDNMYRLSIRLDLSFPEQKEKFDRIVQIMEGK